MTDPNDPRDEALERFARTTFEAGTAHLDADTRARLAAARRRALDAVPAARPSRAPRVWALAATLAIAVIVVVTLERRSDDDTGVWLASAEDADVLLADEPLWLEDDLEFYAWLSRQPEFAARARRSGE